MLFQWSRSAALSAAAMPGGVDDLAFVAVAANAGVSLTPGRTVFCSGSARVRSFASAGFANATELEAGLMRLGTPAGRVGLASAVRARATQRMSGARGRARSIIEEVLEDCLARGQQVIQQRFGDDEAGLASGYLGDPLGHVREPE